MSKLSGLSAFFALSALYALSVFYVLPCNKYLVKTLKFGQIFEIWSKLWNSVKIVRFGQSYQIWSLLWNFIKIVLGRTCQIWYGVVKPCMVRSNFLKLYVKRVYVGSERLSEGSGRLSVGSGWWSIRFGRLYGGVSKSGRWVRQMGR